MDKITCEIDLETFAALADYLASSKQPTQNAEGVHVGDLFYASWGYEQTNIDFYQVVALNRAYFIGLHFCHGHRVGTNAGNHAECAKYGCEFLKHRNCLL